MDEIIRNQIIDSARTAFSIEIDSLSFPATDEPGLHQMESPDGPVFLWLPPGTFPDTFAILHRTSCDRIDLSPEVAGNPIDRTKALLGLISESRTIWLCYSSVDGVPLPTDAIEAESGIQLGASTLSAGLTVICQVATGSLANAFGDVLADLFSLEHIFLSAYFGEDWLQVTMEILSPRPIDWLGDKVQFLRTEIGYIAPYGNAASTDFQVYLNASICLFSSDKKPNAQFFATVDYDHLGVRGIGFDISAEIEIAEGISALASLFEEGAWEFPEGIPTPSVQLSNFSGYLSFDESGGRGLTELAGLARATFESGWTPFGNEQAALGDIFQLKQVGMQFSWQKGLSFDWQIAGEVELASYLLDARFLYPQQMLIASLSPSNRSGGDIQDFLKTQLGVPEEASKLVSEVLTSVSLSLSGNLRDREVEFRVTNNKSWPVLNALDVSEMDLRISLASIGETFGFADAELFVTMELPIGAIGDGGQRDEVKIHFDAQYDGADKLWSFEGDTGPGDGITVLDAIDALVAKLGDAASSENLPDWIGNLVVEYIYLNFDSNGNAEFTLETTFEIDGQEMEFWVHLRRENGSLYLAGSIFINGYQLGVAFAKTSDGHAESDTLILGSLQTPLKLDSRDLIQAIAPDVAEAVPLEVDVELLGMLLAMHAGRASQREYLFRLSFDLDFDLGGFPLIGGMLEEIKFTDGQVLAANRDWQDSELAAVNQLLALFGDNPPKPVDPPQQTGAAAGIGKGISLGGNFQIAEAMGFPLFLQFGGDKKASPAGLDAGSTAITGATASPQPDASQPATPQATTPPTANPNTRSQSKIDQVIGAIRIKKVAMIFESGRLGLKITGGLALAAFEFELMGLQVTVPQSVLNDPTTAKDIAFSLDGFGAEIRKGTLSILGAFLRQHYPATDSDPAYDEFNGIIQVAFPPFNLTAMGSYAKYGDYPSLFLFAALGYPIPVSPALLIEGLALGFGIHRDLIAPQLDDVLSYPLIQVSVTPPPPIDIKEMAEKMHQYFPPADGLYFVVAGVKFKAFGIVDTVAMLAVKFGRSFEIDLIGVSSIFYPAAFIELAWTARFVPEEGSIFIAGQLTSRSYLFIPQVQLTGGFAVAAWVAGEYQGDFVVSIGGYHPLYRVPAHYPDHVSRLGISFHLDPITVKGGVYFAVTPQYLMMGGMLEASLEASYDAAVASATFKAAIQMAMDAIVFFEPFHYDLTIGADATLDAAITFTFYTKHIHAHLHLDVHIWGPEFSGTAALDVGPKTFDVAFGEGSSVKALPISWDKFREKFLQTKDKDGNANDNVCSISVTSGLLATAKSKDGADLYVVDPKQVVIEAKSLIPITQGTDSRLGITPMDIRNGGFEVTHTLCGHKNHFASAEIRSAVSGGIWGGAGLQAPDPSGSADGLVKDVLTGFRLTPNKGAQTPETQSIPRDSFAYNTDEIPLAEQSTALRMVGAGQTRKFNPPANKFEAFTGLGGIDLPPINAEDLLTSALHTFDLA